MACAKCSRTVGSTARTRPAITAARRPARTAADVDRITGAVLNYGDHGFELQLRRIAARFDQRPRRTPTRGRTAISTIRKSLLAGVQIDLLDAQGNFIKSTTTDVNGEYHFTGLAQGNYQVREHQPTEYYDGGERVGSVGGSSYDTADHCIAFSPASRCRRASTRSSTTSAKRSASISRATSTTTATTTATSIAPGEPGIARRDAEADRRGRQRYRQASHDGSPTATTNSPIWPPAHTP